MGNAYFGAMSLRLHDDHSFASSSFHSHARQDSDAAECHVGLGDSVKRGRVSAKGFRASSSAKPAEVEEKLFLQRKLQEIAQLIVPTLRVKLRATVCRQVRASIGCRRRGRRESRPEARWRIRDRQLVGNRLVLLLGPCMAMHVRERQLGHL